MLDAAELGALPIVRAGAAGEEPKTIGHAGEHVHLRTKLGYPEAVDHVGRGELEVDWCVDGNVQLVRGRHTRVAELPPPLMAGGGDPHGRRDPRAVYLGHGAERQDEDHGEDDGGRRGPRDLETTVAFEGRAFSGDVPRCAIAPDRVHERALDTDEDEERDGADDERERRDRVGRWAHGRRVVPQSADAKRRARLAEGGLVVKSEVLG